MTGDSRPPLVIDYARRALPRETATPARVRIRETGEMFREPDGRPLRFEATSEFAVRRVGFSWRARFPLAPLIAMRVHDGYADGAGWMRGSILGVPFMRKGGPQITAGAAMRYLAELPWAPHALLANDQLEWRQTAPDVVEVATRVAEARVAVDLTFDGAGDIIRASARERPRDVDVPRPWGGDFRDHTEVGGVRIPARGEVYWDLPEGRFTYWRATVTDLETLDV